MKKWKFLNKMEIWQGRMIRRRWFISEAVLTVSVNHLLLQMESKSFKLSCMRFWKKVRRKNGLRKKMEKKSGMRQRWLENFKRKHDDS